MKRWWVVGVLAVALGASTLGTGQAIAARDAGGASSAVGADVTDGAEAAVTVPPHSSVVTERGDAAGSAYYPAETQLGPNLAVSFSRTAVPRDTTGQCPSQNFGLQRPVASASTVFLFDGKTIRAVNLTTSRQRWEVPFDGRHGKQVRALAVDRNVLVVGGNTVCDSRSNTNDFITAYDSRTGAHLWDAAPLDPQVRALTIVGDTVVANGFDVFGDVAALDLATGVTKWQVPGCTGYGTVVAGIVPVWCDDEFDNIFTRGLSLATGEVVWSRDGYLELRFGDSKSVPLGGRAFYGVDSRRGFFKVKAVTGEVVWTQPGLASDTTPVYAATTSVVLIGCGLDTTSLCAIDRITGAEVWRAPIPDRLDDVEGIAVAQGVVFPYQLDLATGAPVQWSPSPMSGWAGVAAGTVLVTDLDSVDVYRVRAATKH